jgi:predicted DNA-binding transcriptional regulator AlpA
MAEHYLSGLPAELASQLALNRIIGTSEAASFCNFSVGHWRRLYKENKVPAPVRLGSRKLGWRLGSLIEYNAQRAGEP